MLIFLFGGFYPLSAYERFAIEGTQFGEFAKGKQVYLFGDNVNIRAIPSIKGEIVKKLAIGSPMVIEEVTTTTLKLHDLTSKWYKVSFVLSGKTYYGYVWGGLIALVQMKDDIDGNGINEQLLVGVIGNKKQLELRLVRDFKLVASQKFDSIDQEDGDTFSYGMGGDLWVNKGFSGNMSMIRICFEYGACDYANGDVIFTWNGKKLEYALTSTWATNEVGGSDFTYRFPNDPEGKPDQLLIFHKVTEYDQEKDTSTIIEQRRDSYLWNGSKLQKN
jgi:hypothetical protein